MLGIVIQRFSNRILQAVRTQTYGNQKVLVVSKESYDVLGRLCGRLKLELQYAGRSSSSRPHESSTRQI